MPLKHSLTLDSALRVMTRTMLFTVKLAMLLIYWGWGGGVSSTHSVVDLIRPLLLCFTSGLSCIGVEVF